MVRISSTGHQYSNIRTKGQAYTGDVYSGEWSGSAIEASHKYNDVEVEEGRKVLVGNKCSEKDL